MKFAWCRTLPDYAGINSVAIKECRLDEYEDLRKHDGMEEALNGDWSSLEKLLLASDLGFVFCTQIMDKSGLFGRYVVPDVSTVTPPVLIGPNDEVFHENR